MSDLVTCPDCNGREERGFMLVHGTRNGQPFSEERPSVCRTCKGAKTVTPEQARWYSEGILLRDRRKAEPYRSGKEEAARLGVDPIDLNHAEHGRRDPRPFLEKQDAADRREAG